MRHYYAFHDSDKSERQYKCIKPEEAQSYNDKGFGIFWTVNEFEGARKNANLKKINSWYIDIDDMQIPLEELLKLLPVYPSLVIKTKSGFHVYFNAVNATVGNYKLIGQRLVHAVRAKESVYDLPRLLRVPGFYHKKDPTKPFLIEKIYELNVEYDEVLMLSMTKPHPKENEEKIEKKIIQKKLTTDASYFEKIHHGNQEGFLRVLSGKACVGGEQYGFKNLYGGMSRIVVNGKDSACWIDREGFIGSPSGFGPSVWEWLKYFNIEHRDIEEILKQEIGEL